MNIGILTEGFLGLAGAYDFIYHTILGVKNQAEKNGDKVFILINSKKDYRHYKGLKRVFKKIQSKFFKTNPLKVSKKNSMFANLSNVYFVEYSDINKAIKKLNLDIVFPHQMYEMQNIKTPNVGYLWDCQHKYYPEFFDKKEIDTRDSYFAEMIKAPCVVNSMDAKKDLIKFFNAKDENIFSLPFSPKLNMKYLEDNSKDIEKYNLPKRYFVMSSQFWVHKDHPTLFRAFAKLSKIPEFSDVELVCTGALNDGRRPDYINEIKELIKTLGIESKTHLLGLIPKIEQIEILKHSVAVIQTTLFEGGAGGGAVWDACALGIRSIITDIPINTEVVDDLVTFFKTKDDNDLFEKMKIALNTDAKTFTSTELIEKTNKNIEKLGVVLYQIINTVIARKNQ